MKQKAEEGANRLSPSFFETPLRALLISLGCLPVVEPDIMHRDPVWGAIMDERTAKFKKTYDGETYHFCSATCRKKFKRQPRRFVK